MVLSPVNRDFQCCFEKVHAWHLDSQLRKLPVLSKAHGIVTFAINVEINLRSEESLLLPKQPPAREPQISSSKPV